MPQPDKFSILHERLLRQGLTDPISKPDEEMYLALFRRLQPVSTVYFTMPGSPPSLVHRTAFDDRLLASGLREHHSLIKGRFLGGRVGYVLPEDLKLYATVFRKMPKKLYTIHHNILGLIRSSGGMSKEQLKEELPYPAGEISKALLLLSEAFLAYEDQTDNDWDTGWFDFATEWFEFDTDPEFYVNSAAQIIERFIDAMVFATPEQLKSWSQLPLKQLKESCRKLQEEERIVPVNIPGMGEGYLIPKDRDALPSRQAAPESLFMLDKSDYLVRADLSELQRKYKGQEVLQYLLIGGEFQGAVLGHWRIGPHDVEDIVLDIRPEEANRRKAEIIEAVRGFYHEETSAILKYNGEPL